MKVQWYPTEYNDLTPHFEYNKALWIVLDIAFQDNGLPLEMLYKNNIIWNSQIVILIQTDKFL